MAAKYAKINEKVQPLGIPLQIEKGKKKLPEISCSIEGAICGGHQSRRPLMGDSYLKRKKRRLLGLGFLFFPFFYGNFLQELRETSMAGRIAVILVDYIG